MNLWLKYALIALCAFVMSCATPSFAGIGMAQALTDPRGLVLCLLQADSFVIIRGDVRDEPLSTKGKKWNASSGDTSVLVEDRSTVDSLVRQLRSLDLRPSSYCFCCGQPTVRFYRDNKYLGCVIVKHDDNIGLGDESGGFGYFNGRVSLVREFYEVLSPLMDRAEKDAALAVSTEKAKESMPADQSTQLRQAVAGELKQQEELIKQLPVPVISAPIIEAPKKAN